MFKQIIITKSSLVQLTVLLFCVAQAAGLFIFTESCVNGTSANPNLWIDPLQGTWFMVSGQQSSVETVKFTSKLQKPCILKQNVMFQLQNLNDSVKIKHGNQDYCTTPKQHQWLTAPQKLMSVVSCAQDETTAKEEIQAISNNNDPEFNTSREGKNIDHSDIASSDPPEDATSQPSKEKATTTMEIQTEPAVRALPTTISTYIFKRPRNNEVSETTLEKMYTTDATQILHSTSPSPSVEHTSSSEVPKTNPGEFQTTITTPSSAETHSSSDFPFTTTSVQPLNISKGFANKILYIVLPCLLILFILICACYCCRRRKAKKIVEINQRLVNKKEGVVNFRSAEEAGAQPVRKQSKDNVIEESDVPKCLRG